MTSRKHFTSEVAPSVPCVPAPVYMELVVKVKWCVWGLDSYHFVHSSFQLPWRRRPRLDGIGLLRCVVLFFFCFCSGGC